MNDKKKAAAQREAALKRILAQMPGNDSASQSARILAAIQTLGSITSFEASRYLDCYDPRARVHQLRNSGHSVVTVMRHEETESGVAHRIGVWSLQTGGKA